MTLANKITLGRIILVVPFAAALFSAAPAAPVWALGILAIAAVSDYYDGAIARKRGEVSDIGKFLDPLADKLFVSAGLIIMAGMNEINVPAWSVIIVVSREFVINSLRTYGASKGSIIAASMIGKIKTVIQIIGLFVLLALVAILRNNIFAGLNIGTVSYITALIISSFTLYSGIVYMVKYIRIFNKKI
ncbi:MAG: CDP-diacylglycerol--glycerol-3-phosphate 3-phosphatidyltransferase [Elusimicrobia bacterium]|jgi:CDP-diacylglycerol--glycerol-3-phosphate 3-phosphatidyltransferase|nr:CDP-diacylglycerol--glycerol-3-phosphate 3-phosphatidyltransferase [Elusimicrobiota bacterium]